jgi:hypothetical protein
MYYKDCQVKENKKIGPYHKKDNGEKLIQVFGGANGRKETNFVVDCGIILVWIVQI